MKHYRQMNTYSVMEINGILEALKKQYDLVQLVDVEECRILEVQPGGQIHYGANCFQMWDRHIRCANCTSYRACMTHCPTDKTEHLGVDVESVHSVPIYLETLEGEMETCVIECIRVTGRDDQFQPSRETDTAGYIHTHDVLTNVYTREKLLWEIRQRMMDDPDGKYLLVMGNVRNFKMVNSLFGVEGGNRVLVGMADMLRSACGEETLYGRCRDDRFVLFMKKERFSEAAITATLKKAAGLVDSPVFSLQIKAGVYEIVNPDMPVTMMLDHAELAVDTIRNQRETILAYYHPDLTARKMKEQRVVMDFESALTNGEFQIYLQPQVQDDGRIAGAEALVRWVRPQGEILLPADFLEILHQGELLSHLDLYVWEEAVKLLQRWQHTRLDSLYLSINVDPTDFYYVDVPEALSNLCRKYGVDPRRMRVEITETALVEDVKRQSRMVELLHQAGFLVEIDDFGKGFSSLGLLKDIQADVLKIDMDFVRGERNHSRSRVILESVIGLADSLHMGVVTEGVETHDQVESLIHIGCHYFQGFYYSRPIPVDQFEAIVRKNAEKLSVF